MAREYIYFIDAKTNTQYLTDEEIIRCKDCGDLVIEDDGSQWCVGTRKDKNDDDFCSSGRRRDER